MTIQEALRNLRKIGVNSAPWIYFVEKSLPYKSIRYFLFSYLENHDILISSSVMVPAEVLPLPLRNGHAFLVRAFRNTLLGNPRTRLEQVNVEISTIAAELRAEPSITPSDAVQIASAIYAGCEAFLTNDVDLKK